MRRTHLLFLTALVALGLAACGEVADDSSTTSGNGATGADPITGEAPPDLVDDVLAAASEEANVPADELSVVRDESVEWPDASLDCPEEGQTYAQVVTPGYWIEVDTGDGVLDYRADDAGNFRLCEGSSG